MSSVHSTTASSFHFEVFPQKGTLFLSLLLGLSGCGNNDDELNIVENPQLAERFRECGLASEGKVSSPARYTFVDEHCKQECQVAVASCEVLEASLCGTESDADASAFESCRATCKNGLTDFKCMNGVSIDSSLECDGEIDCKDGDDEHCPIDWHTCDGDKRLPSHFVCNGKKDCADGSDEPGACAALICP